MGNKQMVPVGHKRREYFKQISSTSGVPLICALTRPPLWWADPPPSATGFGRFMSSDDHEGLRKFVLELTRQTLIPTLCSVQKTLGEQVQARRGGLQKTWKLFKSITSNSPASPPSCVREGGREGEREGGREGGRERGREREKEGGRQSV